MLKNRWVRAVCGGLVLCLCLSICGFAGEVDDLRGRVLRLHILANSDSEIDQSVKLTVRDAVVEECAGLLDGAKSADEAAALAETQLDEVCAVARRVLREQGADYGVFAEVTTAYFPTRVYDNVTLPAGRYPAVRLLLGEGKGHNWWCVLFPPLCVSAATDKKTTADVLTPAEDTLVTDSAHYAVKFKVVEWWEALFEKQKTDP